MEIFYQESGQGDTIFTMHFLWKPVLLGILIGMSTTVNMTAIAHHSSDHEDNPDYVLEPPEEDYSLEPDNTYIEPRRLRVSTLFRGDITWGEILNNILGVITLTIFYLAASAFLLGALMYTAGFINEENKSKGKQLMLGSLMGMALVLAARALFNAVYYFVYGV